jgi:hypothetical protein
MNLFIQIPVPAANGSGAPVDVTAFGYTKTVSVAGPYVASITIEYTNEMVPTQWAPLFTFDNPDGDTFDIACRWMRATVSNYKSGTPRCDVGATDDGATFATLVATPGNGAGPAVDVSTLALFKTITVGGPFRGNVQIEISEDGITAWSQIGFGFQNPNAKSEVVAAKWMRVVRAGVPLVDPGMPLVDVGGGNCCAGPPGPPGPIGPMGPPGLDGSSAVLVWGSEQLASAADNRLIAPGFEGGTAPLAIGPYPPVVGVGFYIGAFAFVAPRPGTLKNLFVRHNSTAGNGNSVVYFIVVNRIPTALFVSLATGIFGQAGNIIDAVPVVQGDFITLLAYKAASIGGSAVRALASVELV